MNLQLPFKPFTLDEVKAITGVTGALLEKWLREGFPLCYGDDGRSQGLDFLQTLAIFVAWKYLEEGAGIDRAEQVMLFLLKVGLKAIEDASASVHSFPASSLRVFVKPPDSPLGRRLNLAVLYPEFKAHLARVFPSYEG